MLLATHRRQIIEGAPHKVALRLDRLLPGESPVLDPDGKGFKAFDVQGVSVTIFVDANGEIVHYWVGLDDPSSMDSVLSAMLQTHL